MSNETEEAERRAFEDGWIRCCTEAADAVMPEATFQAWFAHHLIGPFPMQRVAREPDFDPKRSTSPHAATFNTSVHLDIVICRNESVRLPHRASKQVRGLGGWDSLRELPIISEVKIGSSTINGFSYSSVVQDYIKLSMFLDEADERGAEVKAFMCILDNHPTRRANPRMIRRHLERCRPEITTLWWSNHGTTWDDGW